MRNVKLLSLGLLALAMTFMGCTPADSAKPPAGTKPAAKDGGESKEHTHGQGPNGGVMFDFGKYHAEFTVDHPKKECMIVMVGDDEKTPTAVAVKDLTVTTKETKTKEGKVVAPMTITMVAKDATGGKAIKYIGTDPGLGNVADFEGTVIGDADGKPAQGAFKE